MIVIIYSCRIELKGMRKAPEVVYDVFSLVYGLFNGETGMRNISWYDCRDFVVNCEYGVVIPARVPVVRRAIRAMDVGDVRRVSRIAAEVLEWVGRVIGEEEGAGERNRGTAKQNVIGFDGLG